MRQYDYLIIGAGLFGSVMAEQLVRQEKNVYFGGRLAEYKYYNMDQVIRAALNLNRIILSIS